MVMKDQRHQTKKKLLKIDVEYELFDKLCT